MAKGYRPVARDQLMLLPPDMRDWLGSGHPVWVVIEVCRRHLDLRAVHAARRAGGPGAAGYDPAMLAALLVWGYAHRVTSSRRIERLCATDVAFRVICGGGAGPDHVTVARFRAGLGAAAEDMFAGVLVLCARLGMGQLGMVALDGTKIRANASAQANRGEERLRELARELVAAHEAADAAEDELFGAGVRGDELPPELADPQTRDGRIKAALAELEAERLAAERERDERGKKSRADLAARQDRVDKLFAAQRAKVADFEQRNAAKITRTGRGLPEGRPVPPERHAKIQRAARRAEKARQRAAEDAAADPGDEAPRPAVRNLTDPHSRLMPVRGGGFIQGYNAQVVATADGLILATELTCDTGDVTWFEPMLRKAEKAAALMAGHREPGPGYHRSDRIGLFLADAGYLSEDNLTCDGPNRLIAVGKRRDLEKAARDPAAGTKPAGPATTAMAERLKTSGGIAAYRHRGHIAETPHGHIKHNMGIRQLSVRGKPRATAEWALAATVHNLFKAITTGHLTTQALTALTS